MTLHDLDESVPSAHAEAREPAWLEGDSSASVCQAERQQRSEEEEGEGVEEEESLTSP